MMMPEQWESLAQERQRDWEKEMRHQQLLLQLPQEAARWQRWTGSGMVWVGTSILRWGERMAQRECQESVATSS